MYNTNLAFIGIYFWEIIISIVALHRRTIKVTFYQNQQILPDPKLAKLLPNI